MKAHLLLDYNLGPNSACGSGSGTLRDTIRSNVLLLGLMIIEGINKEVSESAPSSLSPGVNTHLPN